MTRGLACCSLIAEGNWVSFNKEKQGMAVGWAGAQLSAHDAQYKAWSHQWAGSVSVWAALHTSLWHTHVKAAVNGFSSLQLDPKTEVISLSDILLHFTSSHLPVKGLPWWLSDKEASCQCRRPRFDLWVGKIAWRKEMATHSSILVGEIPWKKEPGRLQSNGLQKTSDTT